MTIGDYFTEFVRRLRPTPTELEKIRGRRDYVERMLKLTNLGIYQILNSGSYGRSTTIRPVNDIDLFIYLSKSAYTKNRDRILHNLARDLRPSFAQNNVVPEHRSVKVKYADGFSVDVVPALCQSSSKLEPAEIIDRTNGRWILTYPKKHKEFAKYLNTKDSRYSDLFRIFKSWKVLRRRNFRSYMIELLVGYCVLEDLPKGYDKAVHRIFEIISDHSLRKAICFNKFYTCPKPIPKKSPVIILDPANVNNNVADDMTKEMKLEFLNSWNDSLNHATKAIKAKGLAGTVREWRMVFDKFPSRF